MIVFPNCKINLGLQVIRKRSDGYHDISTAFYPIPLSDSLEIIADHSLDTPIVFTSSGLPIDGTGVSNNLCVRAFELIKKDHPGLPPVRMHLHKVIPMGAGLGGGSSDAAYTLKLIDDKFQLGISTSKLEEYALELGSDCPFFIRNKPCLATGRGEQMIALNLDLSAYSFVLIYPAIHIGTSWAFSEIVPSETNKDLSAILSQPIESWKHSLVNDFEAAVFRKHPELASVKQQLYEQGALYASLTGSGSVVYGIFSQKPLLNELFDPSFDVFIL